MAKKCKYLREGNLCAARSFRMQNIALLAVKTVSGGVPRTTKRVQGILSAQSQHPDNLFSDGYQ